MGIVVTGAQGFVGMNLVRHLAGQRHTVYAIGRREPDVWTQRFLEGSAEHVNHRVADLSESGSLASALKNDPVDTVIHAAVVTATTLEVERDESLRIVQVNVCGTMEALDLARQKESRRFVYISSPSAIGSSVAAGPVDESVPANPDTLYGISKMASEALVRRYANIQGLAAVAVRIAQPYGPGERPTPSRVRTSPIYEWLRDAGDGNEIPTGPLDRHRDWTFINETTQGIGILTSADQLEHDLYHLGAGRQFSVGQVIEVLRETYPDLTINEHPDEGILNPNISGPGRQPLDTGRFRREFGWAPEMSIEAGMRRYLEWWQASSR